MENKIVIGLNYGDEGKGLFTDYLSTKFKNSIVIRYSGGQQAGHTVWKSDKLKHVFSNFGSGTLNNIPTYWMNTCTFDPISFTNELKILQKKGFEPIIYIHPDTPVTTIFDILSNRTDNDNLTDGTCGLGVGKTFQREEDFYHLHFSDFFYNNVLKTKFKAIQYYYKIYEPEQKLIDKFFNSIEIIKNYKNIIISSEIPKQYKTRIFEGSQGLLLDQHIGFFPNVTRANTGIKNIRNLIKYNNTDIYLITRAYQTRHGAGYISNTDKKINIKNNPDETNVYNNYQGNFIKSMLDLDLIEYSINKETDLIKFNLNLVITCLDLIDEYKFTYNDKVVVCKNENDFITKISGILKIKNIFISKSRFSENIKFIKN